MPDDLYANCTEHCERMPECAVCHKTKKPTGRDAPLGTYYCDNDCVGYQQEPTPGHLWPGELASIRTLPTSLECGGDPQEPPNDEGEPRRSARRGEDNRMRALKHNKKGNCWSTDIIYDCRKCLNKEDVCDVCHAHDEPRGLCEQCPPCEACVHPDDLPAVRKNIARASRVTGSRLQQRIQKP